MRAVNFSVFTTNSVGMFLMFHSSKTLFTKLLSRNFWSISRYFPSILESGCLARAEECLLMSVPAKLHFFPRARQMLRMIFIKAQYVSNVDVLFSQTFLQRYRNCLSVIYLLKLKVQVTLWQSSTSISKLVEMFICQIFLMDYSIWVAKFWGKIYQKLSNNSELKTWQGRKYRILNLPRAFKDTQSSKLLFKVSPPHIILVSSWFVLCPENWVAEHIPTQR